MSGLVKRRRAELPVEDLNVSVPQIEVAQQIVLTGNIEAAAKASKVSVETVRGWIKDNEDFQKLIEKFTDAMMVEMKAQMVGVAREALEIERGIMKDDLVDANVRIKAAQDIMDRAGFSQKKQQQLDINNNHFNFFANMPDEELNKIIDIDFDEVEAKKHDEGDGD